MNVREENQSRKEKQKMTSARHVIRLVIEDIDSEIRMVESSLRFAEAKKGINNDSKKMAMAAGDDYLTASATYDFSIGYHTSLADECKDRISVLKRKRDYYLSLDKLYAEEKEEAEGNE